MTSPSSILATARERKHISQLAYAGAVTPQEAYALVMADATVKLIDVRTEAERDWIGTVIVPDGQYAEIEWTRYPSGELNPDFMSQLAQAAGKDQVVLIICRSGVRSRYAAQMATEHGYSQCFDVLEGFEGNKDENGHRRTIEGWCKAGLPWYGA